MNAAFYDAVRETVFGGSLSQPQVEGIEVIQEAWEKAGDGDDFKLAYLLGTSFHETARTMQPIREKGSGDGPDADKWDDYLEKYDTGKLAKTLGNSPEADGDGVLYAGRGYVQITGLANYKKASQKLGLDLVSDPSKAMIPEVAALILVRGCLEGWFTGKKLGDYINKSGADYRGARRVVNGTDKAAEIAAYATSFFRAIEAGRDAQPTPSPVPTEPSIRKGIGFIGWTIIATIIIAALGWFVFFFR